MRELLYTSNDVRQEVVRLFESSKGRRIAISAFVGEGAEAYLPKPKGLHLICWPKEGGTNPDTLRKLLKRGVKISFADALHMKVYWTEDQGAVLTSANLSTNALGSGNLKEVGILLGPKELDVDRLIDPIKMRPASERELRELDRLHNLYMTRNRAWRRTSRKLEPFDEWYSSPWRRRWKLGWVDSTGTLAQRAREISKDEYEVKDPAFFISARPDEYRKGDWVLTFMLKKRPTGIEWMFTDYIVKIPKSDRKAFIREYPCQAVQVWRDKYYAAPPFRLDKRFEEAFSKAARRYGPQRIKELKSSKPPKRLIDLTYTYFRVRRS